MRWVFWLGQFLKRPICARVFLAYVRIFRDLKLFERNFKRLRWVSQKLSVVLEEECVGFRKTRHIPGREMRWVSQNKAFFWKRNALGFAKHYISVEANCVGFRKILHFS